MTGTVQKIQPGYDGSCGKDTAAGIIAAGGQEKDKYHH